VRSVAVTWGAALDEPLRRAAPHHVVGSVAELDTLLAKLMEGQSP
jgi:phosphoglycolate phosphatase-like HAD superfamily hydrolase